jgi:hypothetical protein
MTSLRHGFLATLQVAVDQQAGAAAGLSYAYLG